MHPAARSSLYAYGTMALSTSSAPIGKAYGLYVFELNNLLLFS